VGRVCVEGGGLTVIIGFHSKLDEYGMLSVLCCASRVWAVTAPCVGGDPPTSPLLRGG